jgi:hypothetical protein
MGRGKQNTLRFLAVTGMLGSGYSEESLEAGMAKMPSFMGVDAGSTDAGPHPLGSGELMFSREACFRDLRLALIAARQHDVPLIVGSSGGAGTNRGVDTLADMVREVAASESLNYQMARIYSEIPAETVIEKLRAGHMRPLLGAPYVDERVIAESARIVGMMSVEPLQAALAQGAQVVLAGRCSDAAIYSAIPLSAGYHPGLVWHAGKIAECGSAAVADRKGPDSLLCTLSDEDFVVEPLAPGTHCTPESVAAHSLYENADPSRIVESSGTLDTSVARYDAIDDSRVRVSESRWIPADKYTIKLEAAELIGYQSMMPGSIRDPVILEQLDSWLDELRDGISRRVKSSLGGLNYALNIAVYGRNGTMQGLEPIQRFEGHEAFILIDVIAGSPSEASALIKLVSQTAIHFPVAQWEGAITGIAHPYAPATFDRGPVYRFSLNHVIEVEDPMDVANIEMESIAQ